MSAQTPGGPITSLTNPRVKAAVRLRGRHERDDTGLTIVDGPRELLRALETGIAVEATFIAPDLLRAADAIEAADRLGSLASTVEVSPAVLAKIAFGDRSDGIVAVVRTPVHRLGDVRLPDDPLIAVIEAVEKPGNLGAILRSADGAGVDVVVAADPLTDVFNPNAIRASLGTIFARPVLTATSVETHAWLTANGVRSVAAIVEAAVPYTSADLTGPLAIVLGSEAHGLSTTWRVGGVTAVSIPMAGIADSLNVSVAAAVLLFEAVRQRAAT
jgi:RNA methyltransferase, TrmH family